MITMTMCTCWDKLSENPNPMHLSVLDHFSMLNRVFVLWFIALMFKFSLSVLSSKELFQVKAC